jgi:hypothetical protein
LAHGIVVFVAADDKSVDEVSEVDRLAVEFEPAEPTSGSDETPRRMLFDAGAYDQQLRRVVADISDRGFLGCKHLVTGHAVYLG